MSTRATAIATVKSWEETAYDEAEGTPKTVKASIKYAYEGDIIGESASEALMVYVGEEAQYVGLERVTATLAGRPGTFITSSVGAFKDGVAASSWDVVAGSATGELEGLTGRGHFEAPSGNQATIRLDYELG
jgi:hypothetical protein